MHRPALSSDARIIDPRRTRLRESFPPDAITVSRALDASNQVYSPPRKMFPTSDGEI
jgi:hypothetical protein